VTKKNRTDFSSWHVSGLSI